MRWCWYKLLKNQGCVWQNQITLYRNTSVFLAKLKLFSTVDFGIYFSLHLYMQKIGKNLQSFFSICRNIYLTEALTAFWRVGITVEIEKSSMCLIASKEISAFS